MNRKWAYLGGVSMLLIALIASSIACAPPVNTAPLPRPALPAPAAASKPIILQDQVTLARVDTNNIPNISVLASGRKYAGNGIYISQPFSAAVGETILFQLTSSEPWGDTQGTFYAGINGWNGVGKGFTGYGGGKSVASRSGNDWTWSQTLSVDSSMGTSYLIQMINYSPSTCVCSFTVRK